MTEVKLTKAEQEKETIKELPSFTKEELKMVLDDLERYMIEHRNAKHFMLLSKDQRYYTIFQRALDITTYKGEAQTLLNFLQEDAFLTSLGELKVLKRTGESEIEIWIGETPFLLFIADGFFVKI